MYVPPNIKEFCSTRETSHEIGLAIFQLADKGDEVRMWSDPTDDEEDKIIERAWNLTDEDVLYWGNSTYHRQGKVPHG